MKLRVIVNPTSGGGKASDAIPVIERLLEARGANWTLARTTRPGHASALARQIVKECANNGSKSADHADPRDVLIVVGGDGTLNEVCQAFVDSSGRACLGPRLGVIPTGTGSDFSRSRAISSTMADTIDRILTDKAEPLDLGVARVGAEVHAFVNVASFGLSGQVASAVNQGSKWLTGRLAYLFTSLQKSLLHDNPAVELLLDGTPWFKGRVVTVAIANGKYFGGGMQIAPQASTDDGLFDVVVLGDLTKAQTLGLARHIYRGSHIEQAYTTCGRGRRLEARVLGSDDPPLIELDGENRGSLPATFEILPGAISLLGGAAK